MIKINAVIPRGIAKRLYKMEINGFRFSFEIENNEQAGKEPVEVLYDELRVIIGLIEKHLRINQPDPKELPEGGLPQDGSKITLDDLKNGDG